MNDGDKARLGLAKRLRELADNSSEAQLRASLSRSYYSIYHAAKVLLDNVHHHNIAKELGGIDPKLGEDVEVLRKLRDQADYDPALVGREFGGDQDLFRGEVKKQVDKGLTVFRRILRELENKEESGGGA